jgi:hypothetical protein
MKYNLPFLRHLYGIRICKSLFLILSFTTTFLISCDNGTGGGSTGSKDNNPFKGTWVSNYGGGQTIVFSDSTWELTGIGYGGYKEKGTYTYDGNIAQITVTHISMGGGDWSTNGSPLNLILPLIGTGIITGNKMDATYVDSNSQILAVQYTKS